MKYEIMSTRQNNPLKVIVYGPEGIGKTTFASQFPDPIFIDTEGSTGFINAKKFPNPTSWTMLLDEIEDLKQNPRCKTLVIDTLDWAEKLAKEYLMEKNKWAAIDSSQYGARYVALSNEIGNLLNKLSELIDIGIHVVLLAHSELKKQELPDDVGQFDRYELKLERRDNALAKEWSDTILFANYKTTLISDDKSAKKKATGGKRVMYTSHHPTYDAKNRFNLDEELPFEYSVIKKIVDESTFSKTNKLQPIESEQIENIQKPTQESAIPQPVLDMMRSSNVDVAGIKKIIYQGGFMPKNTPLENIPIELWNYILTNWDKAMNLLNSIK